MLDQVIRAGITGSDGAAFSDYVARAGPGDYVEIGTAFGASAILAALTKRVFQIPGEIYCIDNFAKEKLSPEIVVRNARHFGVDNMIHICVANSHPWPLGDKKFVFGLIDGDHAGSMPARDFINMNKRVTNYIMFDDIGFSNIGLLCGRIKAHKEWIPVRVTSKVAIFQKAMR